MLCEFYNETLEYQENLAVKYYCKHGHSVTVITSTYESVFDYYNNIHDNKLPSKIYYDHGAKIIKLPFKFNFFGKLKKYISIKNIVEEEKPDLLYIHCIMPNMLEMLDYKKKNPKVKMIMDYHADYSNSANNWLSLNILHKIIRKKIYLDPVRKHISRFYPIIPGSTKFLNEVYNVDFKDMEILPLGADVDLVNEIKNSNIREIIRDKYNISNEDVVIFSGGKFNSIKKTHLLISSFNLINNKKLHLFLLGDADKYNEEYKNNLISLSNKNKNIHFLGWQNNKTVYEYLSASDLAVFPASQSIMWLQAIGCGLPIIVGDTGGQSLDYINEFGAIIELKNEDINAENIAESIKKIVFDNELYLAMKKAANKTTNKFLDWNHLIDKTLNFK